jgi:hypothetical protein
MASSAAWRSYIRTRVCSTEITPLFKIRRLKRLSLDALASRAVSVLRKSIRNYPYKLESCLMAFINFEILVFQTLFRGASMGIASISNARKLILLSVEVCILLEDCSCGGGVISYIL